MQPEQCLAAGKTPGRSLPDGLITEGKTGLSRWELQQPQQAVSFASGKGIAAGRKIHSAQILFCRIKQVFQNSRERKSVVSIVSYNAYKNQ
ncbi:hypothetical protein [Allofournierella massiliensis]|uniref:hypothetical protein n=1 Tax=Allofournierella massiliensis TaxID=1650663 RepID=UPI001FAA47D4|nr:hypothetical protein [Fournierella massiliensis]